MPINPKLKAIIDARTDMTPAYKASLIEVMNDAAPDFQNGWMAQDEYTRSANALKTEKEDWDKKNKEFYAKSNTAIEAWKGEVQQAKDAVVAAQARIAELEGGGGTPHTPVEQAAITKEIQTLSAGIKALEARLTTVVTPEDLGKRYQEAVGFIGDQLLTINEIQAQHVEKFGKRLTKAEIGELVKFTNEQAAAGKNYTLDEAYNIKNADELKALERKQWEKDFAEKNTTIQTVPNGGGPGGPGPSGKGPLEVRLDQDRNRAAGGAGDKGYATWQEAAAAAGEELVKEGKY